MVDDRPCPGDTRRAAHERPDVLQRRNKPVQFRGIPGDPRVRSHADQHQAVLVGALNIEHDVVVVIP
jgi:hypothetical protein